MPSFVLGKLGDHILLKGNRKAPLKPMSKYPFLCTFFSESTHGIVSKFGIFNIQTLLHIYTYAFVKKNVLFRNYKFFKKCHQNFRK